MDGNILPIALQRVDECERVARITGHPLRRQSAAVKVVRRFSVVSAYFGPYPAHLRPPPPLRRLPQIPCPRASEPAPRVRLARAAIRHQPPAAPAPRAKDRPARPAAPRGADQARRRTHRAGAYVPPAA